MIWLFLSILSSTGLFVIFKLLEKTNTPVLPVIVINYFTASLIGMPFIIRLHTNNTAAIGSLSWFIFAILVGIFFIMMFFLIGLSTKKSGMAISTTAAKISVIIPISFSMLIDPSDTLSIQKSMGLILAVLAIFFTIYKKDSSLLNKKIALPLLLFLGMGITDSLIRYAQFKYLRGVHVTGFTSYVFLISFIIGIIIIFMKRRQKSLFNITILFYGVLLGLFNYASLYFFIMSLNHFENFDGSTIFAINNTSIVLLASITGLLIFQEKLSNLNKFGIALSICAIYIISTF